ncbi:MAG: HAD family phosphatase [Liquorilactobacillus hordei]|uniref:HAD family hydrolase n=1 Tax=Liquorilactobacillus hordei TaxID=468911 RepID=A0A3S6QNL5_9LACO|nr:HAD family phosphatase [Liquorilactobacillus hordei]AUJ29550.1 HAD family hydrolase [Liquorilactobacillus hordei]MBZ2405199.1 HAD family hydrolase [Liquorilactobacillus hordei]
MNLKLVIFDMDGLVVDSEKIYFAANQRAAKKLGMQYSMDYYQRFIGSGNDLMYSEMSRDYGSKELISEFIRLSKQQVFNVVKEEGIPLKKGFLELAAYLRDAKIPSILASSNDRIAIDYFLETASIGQYFSKIVSANDVTNAKPNPEIFEHAWKASGLSSKDETVILEDSYNGVYAANNAHIPVIMVPDLIQPTKEVAARTQAVLGNLNEVKSYLEK